MSGVRHAVRELRRWVGDPETRSWPAYSRLMLLSDSPNWVLAYEMEEIGALARQLRIEIADARLQPYARNQCVFYASHLSLLLGKQYLQPNRIAVSYFHGRPGSGVHEFDDAFSTFMKNHERIDRVQVSHHEMRELVLSGGIDPAKVHLIPLAVDPVLFAQRTPERKRQARAALNIPEHARVVGSFQKDGVGWAEGSIPKMVKGPDVLLAALDRLRHGVPNLFVLLSGPARGYVREGLQRLGVPYAHSYPENPRAMPPLYQALDVYLVTSRQEGGPKAVLESMAVGVPLVTTRVGQAADLVRHGENGWIVDVGDVDSLARWTEHVLQGPAELDVVMKAARETAVANSYQAQLPLWDRFFDGFVARR